MNKLAIVFAVGAAALLGGNAANASDKSPTQKVAVDAVSQSTDFSAHRRNRHHSHRHQRLNRSYGYYAPRRSYYAPQAYYAQPYYGGGGYGYGGPSISFGIGGGGFGFGGGHGYHGW